MNKVYGTQVLASGQVFNAAREAFLWRELDRVVPAGATDELLVVEQMDEARTTGDPEGQSIERFLGLWNDALAAYRRCDIAAASKIFHTLAKLRPQDGPSRLFLARCDTLLERGIPPGWTGVTTFHEK